MQECKIVQYGLMNFERILRRDGKKYGMMNWMKGREGKNSENTLDRKEKIKRSRLKMRKSLILSSHEIVMK